LLFIQKHRGLETNAQAKGLVWLGVRTSNFDETVKFFKEVLNLRVTKERDGFAVLRLPNDDKVEVFGPQDEDHRFFESAPVMGFLVDDIHQARSEMEAGGVEFIGPIHDSEHDSWSHFRGPDWIVYELASRRE
jgi:predicted enzyme related to lactoylglutathione lyase